MPQTVPVSYTHLADISRVVFLISSVSANEVSAYDVIQNLFPDKNKDFVFNITETEIVLVKDVYKRQV